jgi:hypothetical protein
LAITKPYFRICRPLVNGYYIQSVDNTYIRDARYANDSVDLIRGYHQLEKELLRICDFIEPADANIDCYSHQLYALLLRASTEFEANARAILTANGYSRPGNWNVTDYYKLNAATRLAEYSVTLPIWAGSHRKVQPFAEWSSGPSLTWYQNYNRVKHNRASAFLSASLGNAVTAVAAVFAIVFAQFHVLSFDPHHVVSSLSDDNGILSHDLCLLHVELPGTWAPNECYDFDWRSLVAAPMPFQQYSF